MLRQFTVLAFAGIALFSGCENAPPVEEIRGTTEVVLKSDDVVAEPGDWPWWWGAALDGTSDVADPPTKWSATENIVWQADVPGRGYASPIVVGDRVITATADEDKQQQLLVCYDRKTGEARWQRVVHEGGFMAKHNKNSQASATPASDGERVFAAFINGGALQVTATDLEGEILWQKKAGDFQSEHGYGSSPVLYKSLVIVCGDNAGSSFIAGLDRESGDIVWRTARQRPGGHGNYATPIVREVAGKPQLLLAGHGKLTSYDPASGELLWYCEGPAEVAACTVACSDDVVFASGGYPEKEILAVRADGQGDVSGTHVAWRAAKGVTYVPSPIYHEGRLYLVNDSGVASCYDGKSGDLLDQQRLGGAFSSSPVLAGGKLFAMSEAGVVHVIEASPKLTRLGQNKLGDTGFATPAIVGGQIFLRTGGKLYCIGG